MASSSGAGSSGGPPPCAWVSLTLEEQLENFKRIFGSYHLHTPLPDEDLNPFSRVVKNLRKDPWVDIGIHLDDEGLLSLLSESTPLHWAVLMDDRTMVRYILNSGRVDINASTIPRRVTALHYATSGGNYNIVEGLLEHGADVCRCDSGGESALYYMVRQIDSMFGLLKMTLANHVNVRDAKMNTTLHHASIQGATDVVTYLVEQNADVNALDSNGRTPLHLAAMIGPTDIVTHLVEHNANVNALDDDGWSPLLYSITMWRVDTSIKLIALGADVHVKNKGNNNALHLAIQAYLLKDNMLGIVKLLLERNVDANAKNSKGYSPFFAAVAEGHTKVVKELLQSKEKIKLMEECNGQTVIQTAYNNGHEHIKRALLECDDVSRYVGDLYRDRQVYVDAANAILVGAALIASVTFASWLQPPLGYTTSYLDNLAPTSSDINYVDVQHNASLRAFWVFNTLSFYFATGTVVFGARSVLPRRQMFIKDIVEKLHQNLLVTSILLACSVFFVIIAFGIAGCIVLTPTLKFQLYMIVPTILGGLVCLVSLVFLFKSMVEDNLEKKRKETHLY